MWDGKWEMNYWYTVELCSIRMTLRHAELGIILKSRILTSEKKMFKWSSHISVLVIRPMTKWRESLSFCVGFFPQSPLDPPAVCTQSAQAARSTLELMLGCHGHWSSLWVTGHFSSTKQICIWDCHTSTSVSNLPQHTRHSLCWLDTAHRRSPCFLSDCEAANQGSVFCHLLSCC